MQPRRYADGRLLEFPSYPMCGVRDRTLGPAAGNSGRWSGGGRRLEGPLPSAGTFSCEVARLIEHQRARLTAWQRGPRYSQKGRFSRRFPVAQVSRIARMLDENGFFFTVRRHKELHKELPEIVEKRAKTAGTVENVETHNRINNQELCQWSGSG